MKRATDSLWGAVIDDVGIDLVKQMVSIVCHVTSGNQRFNHRLQCLGVLHFRFFNSIPGPWSYAELTEIHTIKTPSGGLQLEITIWSEDAGITIIADRIELDGEPLL
jgi:hypothetical protein